VAILGQGGQGEGRRNYLLQGFILVVSVSIYSPILLGRLEVMALSMLYKSFCRGLWVSVLFNKYGEVGFYPCKRGGKFTVICTGLLYLG